MNKTPKIYLLDIETSPILGYTWGTWEQNVLKVLEPFKIISCSWKELHSQETVVKGLCDYKGYKKNVVDDEKLVREIWDVLDKADICIAHHGDKFDFKKLFARFVFYGLGAPSYFKTIDTKKVASKYFAFDGNSLNALGQFFGEGKKHETGGFETWVRCMAGDAEAWNLMKEYNRQDVILLEKVYLRLRPFITNHPDLNIITGNGKSKLTCGTCLSTNVQKRGFSLTRTGSKQRFQCRDCHAWGTGSFERNKPEPSEEAMDVG